MKEKDIDFTDKIKLYAATIIVIMAFISSLISYFNFERVRQNGVYTSATVTNITEVQYDDNGRQLTFGIATYYDMENQMHTYSGYVGYSMNKGDIIELIYNRDNPDEVLRNTGSSVWLAGAICLGILAIPLVILSLKILLNKNQKQEYDFIQREKNRK